MIIGIQHSAIPVRDLERSATFYSKVLGFREGFRMKSETGTLTTIYMHIVGSQFLELQLASKETGVEFSTKGFHMAYEVDDVAADAERIVALGVPLTREIRTGKSGCLQTFIADPDGHRIELMQVLPDSMQGRARDRFRRD